MRFTLLLTSIVICLSFASCKSSSRSNGSLKDGPGGAPSEDPAAPQNPLEQPDFLTICTEVIAPPFSASTVKISCRDAAREKTYVLSNLKNIEGRSRTIPEIIQKLSEEDSTSSLPTLESILKALEPLKPYITIPPMNVTTAHELSRAIAGISRLKWLLEAKKGETIRVEPPGQSNYLYPDSKGSFLLEGSAKSQGDAKVKNEMFGVAKTICSKLGSNIHTHSNSCSKLKPGTDSWLCLGAYACIP